MQLTEGLKNSRMERAEAPSQPPQMGQAQIQAPPSSGAPAPQSQASAAPPSPEGIQPPGKATFVDYVTASLHDSDVFQQHEEAIATGVEGAARVAVEIGVSAVEEHQKRGIEPTDDEQAEALSIILDDIVDIGISKQSLPQDREQAEYQIARIALPMWAQARGEDPTVLAQELSQDMTPEEAQKMEQLEQGMVNGGKPQPMPMEQQGI